MPVDWTTMEVNEEIYEVIIFKIFMMKMVPNGKQMDWTLGYIDHQLSYQSINN